MDDRPPLTIPDLDTPALLIDQGRMAANIRAMQAFADAHGVRLRPHVKTHKIPELALMQVRAGARGIAVAKLGEAEVMARHGLDDIQVANQVIGATKIGRLLDLAEYLGPTGRISCAVDSLAGAAALSAACVRRGVRLGVLVEVDSGLHRCGLASVGDVAALSRAVMGLDGLDLLGLLTHAGHAYGAKTPEDVRRIGTHEGALLAGMAETLRRGGIPIGTVSVGSTPTARHAGEVAGVTELRPGNYIFNDMTQVALGVASMDQCGLTVLATVISTPAPGRAVLDAGAKALALDKGAQGSTLLQGHGTILGKRATLARLSEEHGVIEHQGEQFVIGEKVRIVPNHACPVVNLFDYAWLVEGEKIVGRVGIAARGKMR